MKRASIFLLFIFLLAACTSVTQPLFETQTISSTVTPIQSAPAPHAWWEDAIFYEIFVRSFYDSNGDGIGDFNGIIQKLDYLKDLGVTALWLMPIYPSPSYHGYDVIDYFNVNPQYGTLDDFRQLLAEAHKRGIHVILDLVLNHTSSQNPWFVDSNSDTSSPYRDWYIWSDTNPGYLGPVGRAWYPGKYGYFYGIFGANMPDLNYRNPDVTAEIDKVLQFWLKEVGVDGFRIDAANYLIEEGQKQQNTPSTHAWLKGFYSAYKSDNPAAFTVGEVYGSDAALAATYTGDQMDMVFNFELASSILNSVNGESGSAVTSALTFANQDLPNWQFGTFLANHDQNRVMSVLNGNVDKARVAAFLLLTSPGTPFIYYGEEIGMEGEKPDEDIRRPMQWSGAKDAGFTTGTPWRAPGANTTQANVASEESDSNSLLSFYRKLIAIRKEQPVLRYGALSLIATDNSGVFACLRHENGDTILVLVNLTGKAVNDYGLKLTGAPLKDGTYPLTALLGSGSASDLHVVDGGFSGFKPLDTIPAYGTLLWRLGS